jgi:beta-amylase
MLASHGATFNFTCIELRTADQATHFPEAQADPESLVSQVSDSPLNLNSSSAVLQG